MKVSLWKIALGGLAVGVVLAVLVWWVFHLNSELKGARNLGIAYRGVISEYVIEVDSLKEYVAEAELRVVEKERQLMLTIEQKERIEQLHLRNVIVVGELRLSLQAYRDSLQIKKGTDTIHVIEYVVEGDTMEVVPVGTEWSWSDQWASAYAGIDTTGTGYIGFEVKPSTLNIALGSRGVFRKDYVSSATTLNPYLTIDKNNIQVVQQKKAQTTIIAGSLGVAIGVLISTLLFAL